jgi:hypothetical protein
VLLFEVRFFFFLNTHVLKNIKMFEKTDLLLQFFKWFEKQRSVLLKTVFAVHLNFVSSTSTSCKFDASYVYELGSKEPINSTMEINLGCFWIWKSGSCFRDFSVVFGNFRNISSKFLRLLKISIKFYSNKLFLKISFFGSIGILGILIMLELKFLKFLKF